MVLLSHFLSALACTAIGTVSARRTDWNHIQTLQREAVNRLSENRLAVPLADNGTGVKNFTFSNPAASGECRAREVRTTRCWVAC